MVLTTLRAMAKGGMNDQLGGGFHRYSVDEYWFVPHFEKMLYDQAQLAMSYLEAFQITRDGQYASRGARHFRLCAAGHDASRRRRSIRRRMRIARWTGSSEKSEGAFYIWTAEELTAALSAPDAAIFSYRFGVEASGNVQKDPHGEFTRAQHSVSGAHDRGDGGEIRFRHRRCGDAGARPRRSYWRSASKRPRPHLDDKILTGVEWSDDFGVRQGRADPGRAAVRGRRGRRRIYPAAFVERRARELLRRYRDGDAAIAGFLDDYAFFSNALLDLYETAFDPDDFKFAVRLAEKAIELFEDRENGGFFSVAESGEDLVLRLKDDYDGAEPSGNSGMALVLLRLARMTGREDFRKAAERTLEAFGARLKSAGAGVPQMLVALGFALGKPKEIVLAGNRDDPAVEGMLVAIRRHFLPGAVILMSGESATPMEMVDDVATAYVCENYACKLPVTKPEEIDQQLQ